MAARRQAAGEVDGRRATSHRIIRWASRLHRAVECYRRDADCFDATRSRERTLILSMPASASEGAAGGGSAREEEPDKVVWRSPDESLTVAFDGDGDHLKLSQNYDLCVPGQAWRWLPGPQSARMLGARCAGEGRSLTPGWMDHGQSAGPEGQHTSTCITHVKPTSHLRTYM